MCCCQECAAESDVIDFVKKVQIETGQASGQKRLRALCSTPPLLGSMEATASEPP